MKRFWLCLVFRGGVRARRIRRLRVWLDDRDDGGHRRSRRDERRRGFGRRRRQLGGRRREGGGGGTWTIGTGGSRATGTGGDGASGGRGGSGHSRAPAVRRAAPEPAAAEQAAAAAAARRAAAEPRVAAARPAEAARRAAAERLAAATGSGGTGGAIATGTIFVAPNGDDANPGTMAQPLKTVAKARDVVRGMTANMTADITVTLRGGTYQQTSTLTFGNADSGKNGFYVKYVAYQNEQPIITGGKPITGWTMSSAGNGVYSAEQRDDAVPTALRQRQRKQSARGARTSARTARSPSTESPAPKTPRSIFPPLRRKWPAGTT